MRRLIALASVATFLVGCKGNDQPTETASVPKAPKQASVDEPKTKKPTTIALVIGKKQPVTVGDRFPDKVFDSFRDTKQFGSEFNDLPPKFDYHYRARTWETAHTGFGEITYDGTLVAAMYQEDGVKQDKVDEMVNTHKDQVDNLLPDIVSGKRVTYWFWEKDGQRLMICAFQTGRRGIKLSAAMGDDVVMDALGMSIQQAKEDSKRVDDSGVLGPQTFAPMTKAAG